MRPLDGPKLGLPMPRIFELFHTSGPKRFANLKAWVASLVQQFAIGANKELFQLVLSADGNVKRYRHRLSPDKKRRSLNGLGVRSPEDHFSIWKFLKGSSWTCALQYKCEWCFWNQSIWWYQKYSFCYWKSSVQGKSLSLIQYSCYHTK